MPPSSSPTSSSFRREIAFAGALVVLAVLASPCPARAGAGPRVDPRAPLPLVTASGHVEVVASHVEVRCDESALLGVDADCHVAARFELRVVEAGALTFTDVRSNAPGGPDRLAVDDAPVDAGEVRVDALAPGAHTLTIDVRRHLATGDGPSDFVLAPAYTRHVLLGETRTIGTREATVAGPLLVGANASPGAAHTTGALDDTDHVDVEVGTGEAPWSVWVHATYDRGYEGPLAHGGPWVEVGLSEAERRENVRVEVGYEVVLEELFVASVSGGLLDEHLALAAVVEIASPNLLVIVPSFSAGLGVALHDVDRTPRAALRMHLGASLPILGVALDLDYVPELDALTIAPALRIGL